MNGASGVDMLDEMIRRMRFRNRRRRPRTHGMPTGELDDFAVYELLDATTRIHLLPPTVPYPYLYLASFVSDGTLRWKIGTTDRHPEHRMGELRGHATRHFGDTRLIEVHVWSLEMNHEVEHNVALALKAYAVPTTREWFRMRLLRAEPVARRRRLAAPPRAMTLEEEERCIRKYMVHFISAIIVLTYKQAMSWPIWYRIVHHQNAVMQINATMVVAVDWVHRVIIRQWEGSVYRTEFESSNDDRAPSDTSQSVLDVIRLKRHWHFQVVVEHASENAADIRRSGAFLDHRELRRIFRTVSLSPAHQRTWDELVVQREALDGLETDFENHALEIETPMAPGTGLESLRARHDAKLKDYQRAQERFREVWFPPKVPRLHF